MRLTRLGIMLLTLWLTWPSAALASSANDRPPNVLLIVSDDQGYRDLGCYGGKNILTPNLDRLAAEGVRLTSFYVAWPACTPSRASILTGRYPQRNGTYDMFRNDKVDFDYLYDPYEYAVSPEQVLGMDEREILIAQILKQRGYKCAAIGKWDLGQLRRYLPLQRGFDFYYGYTNTGIDYWTHERYGTPSMRRGNELTTEDRGIYATYLFERETLRFIDENKNRPFFIYLAFNAPHSASTLHRPRPGVQAPAYYLGRYPFLNPRSNRSRYMAAVTCMDESIGRILARLELYDLTENTLVIFLSDNGGGSGADNGPLRSGKASMFEGGLRVPCIIRWPGRIPANVTCDEFLTALELFPTIAAAAGAKVPNGLVLDGFNMLPVLTGEQPSPRKAMFWQRRQDRAARVGNWKWVSSRRGSGLFDLKADISEKHDLSDKRPDVLRWIKNKFRQWQKQMAAAEPRGPFRDY